MDNGLVLDTAVFKLVNNLSLNPCCSGQWSSTQWKTGCKALPKTCLNPCCSGQWSSTRLKERADGSLMVVLILVVVDNGLVHHITNIMELSDVVLILVVVDNGLVQW